MGFALLCLITWGYLYGQAQLPIPGAESGHIPCVAMVGHTCSFESNLQQTQISALHLSTDLSIERTSTNTFYNNYSTWNYVHWIGLREENIRKATQFDGQNPWWSPFSRVVDPSNVIKKRCLPAQCHVEHDHSGPSGEPRVDMQFVGVSIVMEGTPKTLDGLPSGELT